MKNPAQIDPSIQAQEVRQVFSQNKIDNPANIAAQKIFILNGSADHTVLPEAGNKLSEFYKTFATIPDFRG